MLAVKKKKVATKSIRHGTSLYREQDLLMLSQKSLERSHPCCFIPVTLTQDRHGQLGAEAKMMAGGSHSPMGEYAQE